MESLVLRCRRYYRLKRTEFRHSSRTLARSSQRDYRLCFEVGCCRAGCVTQRVRHVSVVYIVRHRTVCVSLERVLFRLLRYPCHCLHSAKRIFACRSFSRKHDRARSVEDSVRYVGYLCSRRGRILYHGLEHLRRRDDHLARLITFLDKSLLKSGQSLEVHFNAHVSARDHDSVGVF